MNATTNQNDLQFSSSSDSQNTKRLFRRVLISTRKDNSYLKHLEEQKILKETNPLINTFAKFNHVSHSSSRHEYSTTRQPGVKQPFKLKTESLDSHDSRVKQEPNIKLESEDSSSNYPSIYVSSIESSSVHLESPLPIKQEPVDEDENEILPNIVKDEPHEIKVEQPLNLLQPLQNELTKDTPDSNDVKIEIKEEYIGPSEKKSKTKGVYRPPLPTKNKEFTGFTLFSMQQHKLIKSKNPTAHYMEIYHEIRQQWARVTTAAKRDFEQKVTHFNQEKACMAMLKRIKDALEEDRQERDTQSPESSSSTSQNDKKRSLEDTDCDDLQDDSSSEPIDDEACSTMQLRPRLKKCTVSLGPKIVLQLQIRKEADAADHGREYVDSPTDDDPDEGTCIEMDYQPRVKEEEKESTDHPQTEEFPIADMEKMFSIIDEISQIIMTDPNVERSIKVRQGIEKEILAYRETYANKKNTPKLVQTSLLKYFSLK